MSDARARWRLALIGIAFAAPVAIAYVLYYGGWRPQAVHPYGELVTPPQSLVDVDLTALDGTRRRLSSFRHRWLLVYFGSSECTSMCEQALYKMQQVIAAQGREAQRLRAAIVTTDARALELLRRQLSDYPDVVALIGPQTAVAQLANQFGLVSAGVPPLSRRIYVVDPLGNLMMSYPATADPSGMRKDLARLLRASQVG